jgi:hypothetical protein
MQVQKIFIITHSSDLIFTYSAKRKFFRLRFKYSLHRANSINCSKSDENWIDLYTACSILNLERCWNQFKFENNLNFVSNFEVKLYNFKLLFIFMFANEKLRLVHFDPRWCVSLCFIQHQAGATIALSNVILQMIRFLRTCM